MAGRRALISKEDLERMASTVAAHGVVFKGRVDPLGSFTFTMALPANAPVQSGDDLDDRLSEFGSR